VSSRHRTSFFKPSGLKADRMTNHDALSSSDNYNDPREAYADVDQNSSHTFGDRTNMQGTRQDSRLQSAGFRIFEPCSKTQIQVANVNAGPTARPAIRLRQIADADIPAIAKLLSEGFRDRSQAYWLRGLERLAKRPRPLGYPTYGYMLEGSGAPVGAILLLFSNAPSDIGPVVRCNVSSWYVRPEYRTFASLMITATTKDKNVTYFNTTPAPHTWSTVEAQGFSVYCKGQMYALPVFCRPAKQASIEVFDAATTPPNVPAYEILAQHSAFGCLSVIVHCDDKAYPFVFQKHRVKNLIPVYRLLYCRDVKDFTYFAGNLGRFLLKRGSPWVRLDADSPPSGLVGHFTRKYGRKYFKGPHPPKHGDLAYSEAAFFDG
jgi:hypothetical protein